MRFASGLLFAIGIVGMSLRAADAQYGYESRADNGFAEPSHAFIQPDSLASCYPVRPAAWLATFDFDVLVLRRSRVNSLNLVTINGTDALNARDLNFDESFAFRFAATLSSDCGCDLQFNYLTSRDFSDSVELTGTNVQDFFFGLTGSQTDLDVRYKSDFDSLEVNVRSRQWEGVAPLAGFRVIQVDEMTNQLDVTNNLTFAGRADNQLYGFQLGADAILARWGNARLESTVKGGVYYNSLDLSGETATASLNRSFSHVAFAGEVTIAGVLQVGPHVAARLGYQALLLDGIALIFDQYDNFDITTGSGSLDLGRARYVGGFVSLEFTW